jgi:hypothetical protein
VSKTNEPTTEEMLEWIDFFRGVGTWESAETNEDEQAIISAIRALISRQPAVDALVEAVKEDVAARFPYLTLSIATIGEWERRKTRAQNATEAALAAYEKAGEPK